MNIRLLSFLLVTLLLFTCLSLALPAYAQDEPLTPTGGPTLEVPTQPPPAEEPPVEEPPVVNPGGTFFTMERVVSVLMIGLVALMVLSPTAIGIILFVALRAVPSFARPAVVEIAHSGLSELGEYVRNTPSIEDDELFKLLESRLRPAIDKAVEDATAQAVDRAMSNRGI